MPDQVTIYCVTTWQWTCPACGMFNQKASDDVPNYARCANCDKKFRVTKATKAPTIVKGKNE